MQRKQPSAIALINTIFFLAFRCLILTYFIFSFVFLFLLAFFSYFHFVFCVVCARVWYLTLYYNHLIIT